MSNTKIQEAGEKIQEVLDRFQDIQSMIDDLESKEVNTELLEKVIYDTDRILESTEDLGIVVDEMTY